ncbi:MAG TPA: hypothetical protein VGM24_13375 [Puia sp.]
MRFRSVYLSGKILAISALFFTTSCKKDIGNSLKSDDAAAASISDSSTVADNAYNDVFVNAYYGYSDNLLTGGSGVLRQGGTTTNAVGVMNHIYLSCASYTVDTTQGTGYPITLTLDFGADGCSNSIDSIRRQGKIIYVFTGPLVLPGSSVSATFDHYFVNGYGLQGSCTITNTTTLAGFSFTSQVSNGIFTFPDLTNFHYSGNKTITLTAGSGTPYNVLDDVYSITGNSNFSASDGTSLVSTVSTPLTKAFICPYVSAGVISFVFNQSLNGTIDFGDGTCDHSAELAVGSITRQINLR